MVSKNTKPELTLRSYLSQLGRKYRIHFKSLPGKPDIVFTKQKLVVFVHGCYWHRHAFCANKTQISEVRDPEWAKSFNQNVLRDKRNTSLLEKKGWEVFIAWECQISANPLEEARKIDKRLKALDAE